MIKLEEHPSRRRDLVADARDIVARSHHRVTAPGKGEVSGRCTCDAVVL
jgi:hypothetical protein